MSLFSLVEIFEEDITFGGTILVLGISSTFLLNFYSILLSFNYFFDCTFLFAVVSLGDGATELGTVFAFYYISKLKNLLLFAALRTACRAARYYFFAALLFSRFPTKMLLLFCVKLLLD